MLKDSLDRAAEVLAAPSPPKVGLVLGSGLGGLADTIEGARGTDYSDIPGMPTSSVAGHAGRFVQGSFEGVPVIAMQGRTHLYEGHGPDAVVFGARLMCHLGANQLLVTNAAGGLDPAFSAGELMVIEDHLNLTGTNPLIGPNDDRLGPRFPDMTAAYDPDLRATAARVAQSIGVPLRTGVYAGLLGPTYETPAEVRMLQKLGASAVGMSTVLEVIAARHMGARVLGISCITNLAAGLAGETLSHEEVQEEAAGARESFSRLVQGIVQTLDA